MPRSRSRERGSSRSRDKRSRSRNRRSRSRDRKRDQKRKDRSRSRDRHNKRERYDKRDRSPDRRHRDKSAERSKRRDSRDRRRDGSLSRSKKHRRSSSSDNNPKIRPSSSQSGSQSNVIILESNQKRKRESTSSTDQSTTKRFDPRKDYEIANEFSIEGFEQFTRENGIDFSKIETDEDRESVHEKMEELLKAHFAAQGKVYPPVKVERPAINAATGFANDGSFMEQFKRMQEEYKLQQEAEKKRRAAEERLKSLPIRRRGGGKILKTGVVAKTKLNEDGSEVPAADAWSAYFKEVQKYKNSSCDSDSQTRPLVK